jgi:hypothetical protein
VYYQQAHRAYFIEHDGLALFLLSILSMNLTAKYLSRGIVRFSKIQSRRISKRGLRAPINLCFMRASILVFASVGNSAGAHLA